VKKCCYLLIFLLLGLHSACSTRHVDKHHKEHPAYRLVVLHTNDTHGHPVRFFYYPAPDVGGLPARATLIRQIREENENVLVLDAGDINTGRAESNLFKAKPDIEGYNYIGYDAMVLGNHEFDNPIDILKAQMEWAHFPFLSANVKTKNGDYLTRRYIIKEFGGFKVAIFGLTTKETEIIGNPEYIKNLVFEDEIKIAKRLAPELKRKADIVIALVHMGLYPSLGKGSKRLASEVSSIDLIIDGHTHTRLDSPVIIKNPSGHKTFIVQAWKWGLVLGRVDLWIKNREAIDLDFKAMPINLKTLKRMSDGTKVYHFVGKEIKEDEKLAKFLQTYVDKVDSMLSEVIGHAEETFFYSKVRERETALGDLIADSMLWYTKNMGVDFAIQNGGGIRADLFEGQITMQSLYEILPFDNSVVVVTLKGSDLQSLFDFIATISGGRGAFPQVSKGLSFTINRVTGRCENIRVNGDPIDPGRTYKIATNSYLANGGDGYKIFLNAVGRYDTSMFQRDVFIQYIKYLGGMIKPKARGRIGIIFSQRIFRQFKLAA